MELLAELVVEFLSSRTGLGIAAAVVTITVVLSSGLAALVVELSEGILAERDAPVQGDNVAGQRCDETSSLLAQPHHRYTPVWRVDDGSALA